MEAGRKREEAEAQVQESRQRRKQQEQRVEKQQREERRRAAKKQRAAWGKATAGQQHAKQKRETATLRSKSHMAQVQGGKVNAPSPSPPLLCCLVMCGMNRWNVCNCSDGGTLGSGAHPERQIES